MLPKIYANIANVRKTNIRGIETKPSKPSVKFVAFVDPIIINKNVRRRFLASPSRTRLPPIGLRWL